MKAEITILIAVASVLAAIAPGYFVSLQWYRWQQQRAAKRVIRLHIAAACRGDQWARSQVASASHYLNEFNK